jgi:hypothetical protein
MLKARPKHEWHEDMGPVLWWKFPISEAPYVGTPLDLGFTVEVDTTVRTSQRKRRPIIKKSSMMVGGWPGYHTHFTMIDTPER